MKVTIHQPEHLPWLGFFNKAVNCDVFVLLDTVQYEKNYFQNRNQIISSCSSGKEWLTVPVKKGPHTELICEKLVAFNEKTKRRYINQIDRAYSSYPFYKKHIGQIKEILNNDETFLSKININLIKYFFDSLGINCELLIASDLSLPVSDPGGIINYHICKSLGATTYLSGASGKNYLIEEPFQKSQINIEYQNFKHPKYEQPKEEFVPNLSVLDILFSFKNSKCYDIIRSGYTMKNTQ